MTQRERIQKRKRDAAAVQPVATPEWPEDDGLVFARKVSAREMDKWQNRTDPDNGRGSYAAMVCCDQAGNRIFNDEDASWLGDEPFGVIDRIFDAGMAFNRCTPAAKVELEKNSGSGKDGDDLPTS